MSKFGLVSKTHIKHGNFHNRGGSPLKLTSDMTTIGSHIISKFQLCIFNINEVITNSVLIRFIQDHLRNKQKQSNFYNRDDSPLKLTPEGITIGAHIVSKFQLCTPNISKVITKSVHGSSFQDHLTFKPLYINLGQN